MKLYTTDFNANAPSPSKINVPNFSKFGLGITVWKNGSKIDLDPTDVILKNGATELSAKDSYNGYVCFELTAGNENEDKVYDVKINKGYDVDAPFDFSFDNNVKQSNVGRSVSYKITKTDDDDVITQFKGQTVNSILLGDTATIELTDTSLSDYVQSLKCGGITFYRNNSTVLAISPSDDGWYYSKKITDDKFVQTIPQDIDKISFGYSMRTSLSGDFPLEYKIELKTGEPFTGTFKSVVNSVKSSVIDVDNDTITPQYELPVASSETLGGVKVGENLTIDADGTLNADAQELAPATTTTLGGVIVGSGLSVDTDGKINAVAQGGSYNAAIIVQPYRAEGEWYISEDMLKEQPLIVPPYTDPIVNPPLYFINPTGSQSEIHTIIIVENGVDARYECVNEQGMPLNQNGTPLFLLAYERGQLYFWGYSPASYAWVDPMPDGEALDTYTFRRAD